MSMERPRKVRSLEQGTLLSRAEYTKPLDHGEIIPHKHFLIEGGRMVEIVAKREFGNDKIQLEIPGKQFRKFSKDEKIEVYEAP